MSVVSYLNGRFVTPEEALVPIDERGHQFGDGVYEVVRVYNGHPFLLSGHLARLAVSLKALRIENPHSDEEWQSLIYQAIDRSGEQESIVYWQVTRGMAPRSHGFPDVTPSVSLTVRPTSSRGVWNDDSASWRSVICLPDERWANAYIKSLNLLPNVLAKEAALQSNAVESLLVRQGKVLEGSSSNVWFVKNGELWTAPANRYILGGITRDHVLGLARSLGIKVVEQALSWREISDVDEVFLTGTTIEVLPVGKVQVSRGIEEALDILPDERPSSHIHVLRDPVTLWQAKSQRGSVSRRILESFRVAAQQSISESGQQR